jgi:hypothetical protein
MAPKETRVMTRPPDIPINDTQATHFGINIAINAIWNLEE